MEPFNEHDVQSARKRVVQWANVNREYSGEGEAEGVGGQKM